MYDVIVIGGGCVGAGIVRALGRYELSVALLERENDVATGATRANSAIVHAGYDPKPGTLMAKLNVMGSRMMPQLCADLSVPYRQNGAMVLAFDEEDEAAVRKLYARGLENGVEGLVLLTPEQARAIEPNLTENLRLVLHAPTSAIVSPWELTVAMCDNAIANGVEYYPSSPATDLTPIDGGWRVTTPGRVFDTRYVVNAAGVQAAAINAMAGCGGYTMQPSKGQYYVLDKIDGKLFDNTIFQVPTKAGKGVLVSPTVHGNLIVGPDATASDPDDTSTSARQLAFVRDTVAKSCREGLIPYRDSIRNFAGVRANSDQDDFVIELTKPGYVNAACMKSPGLSSSPAVGLEVCDILAADGLVLREKEHYISKRENIFFRHLSPEDKQALIAKDPHFGRIICRCESITEGEILQALASPTCPATIDGVKRRCNAGLGRCQGGFCGPRVCELIAKTRGIALSDVQKDLEGSYILTGQMP